MHPIKKQTGAGSETPPFTWVADAEGFRKMLDVLEPADRLALDIEADSLYHYFEKVCLIQASSEGGTFVLDPLAVRDLDPLGRILEDPAVEKVLHAATYDIYCLSRGYGFSFRNIFDTHIAAQFLGHEQLGLDALLEHVLGITHSKRRQRDDWSHRPLAAEQLAYAAMDTHYLLKLRDELEQQLRAAGRLAWALEEFSALCGQAPPEREFDPQGFRRIKGSRELSLLQLSVLRNLYLLRDRLARELDVPPFKVMNNTVLMDLTRHPPRSPGEMFKRPGISFRVARKYAKEICRTIESARSEDPAPLALPARSRGKAPSREARVRLEALRRWRRAKAEAYGLHVGVLFPGALLEALASIPPADLGGMERVIGMRSWRSREFGTEILGLLQSHRQE